MTSSTVTASRTYGHLIGTGSPSSDGQPIRRIDPAHGVAVAEWAHAGATEVDAAVRAARAAFDDGPWPRMPRADRAALLRALASAVDSQRERLAQLDSEEVGKPLRLARGDLEGAVAHVDFAAALALSDHGESWTGIDREFTAWTSHEPVGVAALVIPWNFPALILAQKLPYALAAGCTVVVKPSELTSSSALEIGRLALEVGIPEGVVNVVTGLGQTTGEMVVTHAEVDLISFTGSTATGRRIAERAGRDLKRVGLELGGKGANVVFADADLEAAADAVVYGAFFNQGECCVAGARLIVERRIADELVDAVLERTGRLAVGDPRDDATDVGALIHDQHVAKVLETVDAGIGHGGELLVGGRRLVADGLQEGCFVEPTIVRGVEPRSPLFDEEVFGPVLSITEFDDLEHAVSLANDTQYGLANAVWTTTVATATAAAEGLRSGTVWINTTIDGAPALAFGGMKASGIGREVGLEGLREFTESKTVQVRRGGRQLPLPRGGVR